MQRTLDNKVYYGLATHIENALDLVRSNKSIVHPQLNRIRTGHPDAFNAALDCLRIIERDLEQRQTDVKVIVVAHGMDTASALVATANELLGVNYAVGFNVPLYEKAQLVLEPIIRHIQASEGVSEVLLLVDMGSLTTFGADLAQHCNVATRTIQLISTMNIVEAIQSAMNGLPLQEVYHNVLMVNQLLE